MWRVIVFTASVAISTNLRAERFTAQALYSLCSPDVKETQQDRDLAETMCGTYVLGLTDGMFMMQALNSASMTPCLPDTAIDVSNARRIFNAYLKNHPQAISNSAGLVMGTALAEAYRCGR